MVIFYVLLIFFLVNKNKKERGKGKRSFSSSSHDFPFLSRKLSTLTPLLLAAHLRRRHTPLSGLPASSLPHSTSQLVALLLCPRFLFALLQLRLLHSLEFAVVLVSSELELYCKCAAQLYVQLTYTVGLKVLRWVVAVKNWNLNARSLSLVLLSRWYNSILSHEVGS
ncbi:hypothetical protein IC582_023653 [Cucumis melo]